MLRNTISLNIIITINELLAVFMEKYCNTFEGQHISPERSKDFLISTLGRRSPKVPFTSRRLRAPQSLASAFWILPSEETSLLLLEAGKGRLFSHSCVLSFTCPGKSVSVTKATPDSCEGGHWLRGDSIASDQVQTPKPDSPTDKRHRSSSSDRKDPALCFKVGHRNLVSHPISHESQ